MSIAEDPRNLYHDRRTHLPTDETRQLPVHTTTEQLLGHAGAPERRVNPENLRSAKAYWDWMGGRGHFSMDQLGEHDRMDDAEAKRGYTSYPIDHPMHPANRRAEHEATAGRMKRREMIRDYHATRTDVGDEPVKRNTSEAICANCKGTVKAGQGLFVKTSSGYKVVHEIEPNEPKAGRPAGKPRTQGWIHRG